MMQWLQLYLKVQIPMIYGSGNWGSFLGDKAAAERYTECRVVCNILTLCFSTHFYDPVVSNGIKLQ